MRAWLTCDEDDTLSLFIGSVPPAYYKEDEEYCTGEGDSEILAVGIREIAYFCGMAGVALPAATECIEVELTIKPRGE